MQYLMGFGDTNFIGVVNADKYNSFVNEDWELKMLLQHFVSEMHNGHILVFQMTEEGIEHSWNVNVKIGVDLTQQTCYRKEVGFIKVTDNQLFLVDYDCLTMAAQFSDEKVPDKNCSKYKIIIKNGVYKVEVIQFYNVDKDEFIGNSDTDILLSFTEANDFKQISNKVFWCTY